MNTPRSNSPLLIYSLALLLSAAPTQAGSATWSANPATSDWNTAANWMPETVPNGPADSATFTASSTPDVLVSASVEVSGIDFGTGALGYSVTAEPFVTLTISGTGVSNGSGSPQSFVSAVDNASNIGATVFTNRASAGSQTTYTNEANTTDRFSYGAATRFLGHSSTDHASCISLGAAVAGAMGASLFSVTPPRAVAPLSSTSRDQSATRVEESP